MRKLTTEEFINKSKKVHGDRFDYSKVEYVNSQTKVCIICSKHGEFWQKPNDHLSGKGCPKCVFSDKNYILSKDDFIEKAKEVHGDKYDYYQVEYVNNSTKVCILCPKHGEFWQLPKNHVYNRQGCPKCKFEKNRLEQTKTTNQFIEESRKIHGDKYDYSKVEYVNANTKVCIICSEHGEFWQAPSAHINFRQGCPVCGKIKTKERTKLTTEEFIQKAREIHGNKYRYSKTVYINKREKVSIICPIHGIFNQLPSNHLNGQGCPECGKIHAAECRKKDYQHFINESRQRFGDNYTFPKIETEYINSHSKITITCLKCGNTFIKIAGDHLTSKNGGCKVCRNSQKETKTLINEPKKHRVTKEEANNRLKILCENKFKFDIEEYVNTQKPISLTCIKCGKTFKRDLNALQYNSTCPYCNGKSRNRKYTTEEFVKTASEIHNHKYDYSETKYETTDKKVTVICHELDVFGNEHGKFYVTPHAHIGPMKSGCPKCSGKYHKTTEEFIAEANLIHDNMYDYSKTEYINAHTKVMIICPIHGEFKQKPNMHLQGNGCPICKQSKCERKIRKLLNNNYIEFIPQYKPTWLKPLSLDFYLPEYNIGIEVQGLQHYKPVKYWAGKRSIKN